MKHLVKKFLRYFEVGDDVRAVLDSAPVNHEKVEEIVNSKMEGYYAIAFTDKNEVVQTFKCIIKDQVYCIPEPDPVVIYFDTARLHHKTIREQRIKIFNEAGSLGGGVKSLNANDFYWYYGTVCNFIVFIFLSLEAQINKMIPPDFIYEKVIEGRRKEVYDKYQIQRSIEFGEKIKIVIPRITSKDFVREYARKYEQILKLKAFRDDIVHTKSLEGKNTPNFYEDLFVMSLNFNFDNSLYFVRDYLNYYQHKLIEECPCNLVD